MDIDVQGVGSKETPSTEGETPQSQPLTEERIAQLVKEQVELRTDIAKREIQSMKDKARAEVENAQRRARFAETESASYKTSFANLDEETQKDVELAQLRGQKTYLQQMQEEEQRQSQHQAMFEDLYATLSQHAELLGIDPNDKRVEWGDTTEAPEEKNKRILLLLGKIQRENLQKEKDKLEKDVKEGFAQIRKEQGLDSGTETTTTPGGVSNSGIPTDMKTFRTWVSDLPSSEYEKLKPAIDKMLAQGKIK